MARSGEVRLKRRVTGVDDRCVTDACDRSVTARAAWMVAQRIEPLERAHGGAMFGDRVDRWGLRRMC